MISEQSIPALMGRDVRDLDGHKIGSIGQIYVDPSSGRPNWATVKTGFFGTSESFVPLDQADEVDGDLRVPYSKQVVKDAPNIEPDRELSDEEADRLYDHYQVQSGTPGSYGESGAATGTATGTGMGTATGTDRDDGTSGGTDGAMTRSEEHLRVGTEQVQTGRARLRKYVVTEQQNVTVPVSREEVRLEREPITDGNVGDALDGPDISEGEHEVVLTEERPVIEKETVPVERVRLDKETVTDQERVSADLRKEEIELDDDGTRTGTDGR